jgi:trans-2,3-dihydro-3-hydroxyanthranilate isomerase
MAVLATATPHSQAWKPAFDRDAAFLYTRETEGHNHSFRARMFAPELGVIEDPATGSAVAAFAGAVREFDALPDGNHAAIVEQGFEMGRPSLIRLDMAVERSTLTAVRIGGHAIEVAAGTLAI